MSQAADVLSFWFRPDHEPKWFEKDAAFDAACQAGFAGLYEEAAAGRLDGWMERPEGALALIVVLDQIPRNIFRGSPRAYATDEMALTRAVTAIDRGHDMRLGGQRIEGPQATLTLDPQKARGFVYMPYQHSEDLADQQRAVELFATLTDDPRWHNSALRHRDVIARFGRFPHRNTVLGRTSTAEERAFLAEPGSTF